MKKGATWRMVAGGLVCFAGVLTGNWVVSAMDDNPKIENFGLYALLASFACMVVGAVVVILEGRTDN